MQLANSRAGAHQHGDLWTKSSTFNDKFHHEICGFNKIKIYWHVALFKLFLLHFLEIRLLKH